LPSFVDSLIGKGLLELEFLYGRDAEADAAFPTSRPSHGPVEPPARPPLRPVVHDQEAPQSAARPIAQIAPLLHAPANQTALEWYCEIMGQELGPMTFADLRSMASAGQVTREDKVRRGVDGFWMAASLCEGLLDAVPQP
jgi:hypothetical protein